MKILLAIGETKAKSPSQIMLDLYILGLEDLLFEEILNGIIMCLKEYDFYPQISQIRRKCSTQAEILTDNQREKQIWNQIIASRSLIRPEDSIDCEDDVLAETIRQLHKSWPELCNNLDRALWDQRLAQSYEQTFISHYRHLRSISNQLKTNYDNHLCGTAENLSKSPSPYITKSSFKVMTWSRIGIVADIDTREVTSLTRQDYESQIGVYQSKMNHKAGEL